MCFLLDSPENGLANEFIAGLGSSTVASQIGKSSCDEEEALTYQQFRAPSSNMRTHGLIKLEQRLNPPPAILMHITTTRQPSVQHHSSHTPIHSPIISLISRARRHRFDILHSPCRLRPLPQAPMGRTMGYYGYVVWLPLKVRTKQRRKDRFAHSCVSTVDLNRNQVLPQSSWHPRHVFDIGVESGCMQG
jgi:hypothetical protein